MIENFLGGVAGSSIFIVCAVCFAYATHDGKGQTLQQHMNNSLVLFTGTIVSFVAGSWILPAYFA